MTEDRVRELMRLVKKQLAPWLVGPEADDLLAEAYYGMWRRLANPPPGVKLGTIAVHGARWALADYLRSHRQLVPRDRHGLGLGKMSSLEDRWEHEEEGGDAFHQLKVDPATPDFAPDLIEEIGGSDLLESVCQGCSAHQARIVRGFYHGMTLPAIAAELHIHRETARQLLVSALDLYRKAQGLPDRGGRMSKQVCKQKAGEGCKAGARKPRKAVTS